MGYLPVLLPGTWDGPTRGAYAHRWLGDPDDPQIVIGYRDGCDDRGWALRDGPTARDEDEVVAEAFANLDRCRVGTELVEAEGARVVVAAGLPHTAEMVLSQRFMLDVHRSLEADQVLVSLARTGAMLACSFDDDNAALPTIVELHNEAWATAQVEERLTELLIVFEAGRKTMTIEPPAHP